MEFRWRNYGGLGIDELTGARARNLNTAIWTESRFNLVRDAPRKKEGV
jgi:hypothetical protein